MKKLIVFLGLFAIITNAFAQIKEPVKWSFSSEKINNKEAKLILVAAIDPGWHIYAQKLPPDAIPIPTSFKFNRSGDYTLIGKIIEPRPESIFDKVLKMQILLHTGRVVFKQKIKLNKPEAIVAGTLEYMVCDDEKCLPPEEIEFSIPVNSSLAVNHDSEKENTPVMAPGSSPGTSSLSKLLPPGSSSSQINKNTGDTLDQKGNKDILSSESNTKELFGSLWSIFIAGFIGGLAAFFMPCIYPMIPLTISYFTKKSGTRARAVQSAFIYGLSIIIIYVSLGLFVTFLFGASALNEAASSAVFNLLFFVILVIFAISFLGAFEITLPSSLVNKADEKSNRQGSTGLFFMAFTLALVSFSCTGPIIGYLLVDSVSNGTYLGPAVGMFGFSLALAIPFTLFATFPSWLKELPKSGNWLNTVKVSLGFLELALALKFLSNVDLAYHWQVFDRDIFLVIWIVIFGLLGFYLLGKIRLSDDDKLSFLSLPRLFFSMLVLAFTIYMIPGLWGAPLKGISAWLPPQSTQDFDLYSAGFEQNKLSSAGENHTKKYGNLFHAPYGIDAFYDYEQGLEHAKKVNKPVLLDFTGWSCTNCRKMEVSVWSDPEVLKRLKGDYVLISLYVDDKSELPEKEMYVTAKGKKIKTLGQKWSDLQASKFNINSQPFYVIVNTEGESIVPPQAFNLDINNYIQFLDNGKAAFQKNKII